MQKLTRVSIYIKKAQAALKKIPEHERILFFQDATTSPWSGSLTNSIHSIWHLTEMEVAQITEFHSLWVLVFLACIQNWNGGYR